MIDIHNPGRRRLPRSWVHQAVSQALHAYGLSHEHVAIILTGDDELRRLNAVYRQQAEVTDVLSFRYKSTGEETEPEPFGDALFGEIYISVPQARRQARQAGHSLEDELVFLAIHGALHLCGLDDVTPEGLDEMRRRGQAILEQTRPKDAALT